MRYIIRKLNLLLLLLPLLLNGQELFLYNETNSPLTSNKLTSLAVDSSNNIWVGSDTTLFNFNHIEWITSLTNGKFFPDIDVLPNGTVVTISSGNNFSNIIQFKNNSWSMIEPGLSSTFKDPINISIKNDTTIYFPLINNWPHQLGQNEIGIYNDPDSLLYILPYIEPHKVYGINSIAPLKNDSLLVSDWEGFHLFDGMNWVLNNPDGFLEQNHSQLPTVKKVKNNVFILGEKFYKYEYGTYCSFSEIDSILTTDSLISTSISVEGNDIFWIGTNKGKIIKYSDSIKTYELTDSPIIEIAIDKDGNKWFISGEGLFIFNEENIVSTKETDKLLVNFQLYQNYPNPFNPTTTIEYSIPGDGEYYSSSKNVTLKVFDILGREIATLVNRKQSAGNYKIKFDASKLTSGIYFYRMQVTIGSASSFVESRKMIIVK